MRSFRGLGLFRRRSRQDEQRPAADELVDVRRAAEADAVQLGEELADLGRRTAGVELDEDADADYRTALDAYETALRIVDGLQSVDDVSRVVDTLAAGRYAVSCVLARSEGRPLPTFRTPCFFDPRHGPASTEVLWNAPGRGTRKVPACAHDAARQAAGEEPDLHTVTIGGRKVPYWEAGGLHQPYRDGYTPRTVREAVIDHKAAFSAYDNPLQLGDGGALGP